jgi:LPXTG-motif cell wall-anchored protein
MTIASPPETGAESGRGWFIALGVVLVILGLVALWNVVDASLITTIIIGWLLVIAGVATFIGAFTTNVGLGWRILQIVLGILYVIVGFDLVADPLSGAIAVTVVIGALLIADGIFRLVAFFMDRPRTSVWMVLLAIINIVFGLWVWTNIPVSGIVIGVFVGVQLLVAGIAWIMAGFMSGSGAQQPVGA